MPYPHYRFVTAARMIGVFSLVRRPTELLVAYWRAFDISGSLNHRQPITQAMQRAMDQTTGRRREQAL